MVRKAKKKKLVGTKKASTRKLKRGAQKIRKRPKKKVLTTPKGYHSVTPYLIIENASAAINFYKSAFGAKEIKRFEKPDKKIGHAELKIGDAKIMLADEYPEMNAHGPKAYGGVSMTIYLYVKNVDQVFQKAIALGATSIRPVEDMFYGDRMGTLEDPFGYKWHVSTHIEDVTPAKMKKRLAALSQNK